MANIGYPLDVAGNKPENIVNEHRTLTKQVEDGRLLVIPRAAPFFVKDLDIKTSSRPLVLGVDYTLILKSFEYTQLCAGNEIVGGILFNSLSVNESVTITYRTLGGEYNVPANNIIEDSVRLIKNPNFTTFSQVVDTPAGVVPYSHIGEFGSTEGYDSLIKQLELLSLALGGTGDNTSGDLVSKLLAEHIKSKAAHSKESVGLGNVGNFTVASSSDFDKIPYTDQKYATPYTVMYAINLFIGDQINDLKKNVETLGRSIGTNNDSYGKLQDKYNEFVKTLEGITTTYTSVASSISEYENTLNSYKISNDEIVQNQKEWLTNLEALKNQVVQYSNEYSEFSQAKNSLLGNMKSLENSYSDNNLKLTQYLETVNNLVTSVRNIENYNIYQKTATYTAGSHKFKLKPNEKVMVTLIGAGGGAGSYVVGDYNAGVNYNGEHGGDTSLWCFQDITNGERTPSEQPLINAGGGFGGVCSFGNDDGSKLTVAGLGGRGGEFTYIKNENILVLKEASRGDGGLKGVADKNASTTYINQQLGYENFGKMFGRGGFKAKAVGAGGEGALVKAVISNPYKVDLEFVINVGTRGRSVLTPVEEALGGLAILEKV